MNDIYTYTVPVFKKTLKGLRTITEKAQAYAQEKGIEEKTLLEDQLISDMFPLKKQIQVSCDNAKLASARLSGMEAPKNDDSEQSFADLLARIDSTLAFLETVKEDSFKDAAGRQITLGYFPGKYMDGFDYAREYAIPNFFFHVVASYAIIRKNGVPIGKADYTAGMPFKDLAI